MVGTAVFRIVVSRDSIKKATATSHGNRRLLESEGWDGDAGTILVPGGFIGRLDDEMLAGLNLDDRKIDNAFTGKHEIVGSPVLNQSIVPRSRIEIVETVTVQERNHFQVSSTRPPVMRRTVAGDDRRVCTSESPTVVV